MIRITKDTMNRIVKNTRNEGIKIGLVIGIIAGILINIGWNAWKESVSDNHYGHYEITGLNPIYHNLNYGNFGDPRIEEFYEKEWVWDCTDWCNGNHDGVEKVEMNY